VPHASGTVTVTSPVPRSVSESHDNVREVDELLDRALDRVELPAQTEKF